MTGFPFLQVVFPVSRKIVHKADLSVHSFETIMAHAICDSQELRLDGEIVPADLRESCLREGYKWSLAFYQQEGKRIGRQDHDIRPFGKRIVLHAGFHGEQ